MKSGNLNFLEHSGPLQACNRTVVPFFNNKVTALLTSLFVYRNFWRYSEGGGKPKVLSVDACIGVWLYLLRHRASVSKAAIFLSNLSFLKELDLDAGRLARSQKPEGPATGHLDPGFLGFPGS